MTSIPSSNKTYIPIWKTGTSTPLNANASTMPIESAIKLILGNKIAKNFEERIKTGPPADQRIFQDPSLSSKTETELSYNSLLSSDNNTVDNLLKTCIPSHVLDLSNNLEPLLASAKNPPRKKITLDELNSLNDAIKKYAFRQPTRTSLLFSSAPRHPKGTVTTLLPSEWEKDFGYIPEHEVKKSSFNPAEDQSQCKGCKQDFGWFSLKSDCANCGNACCSDCIKLTQHMDYSQDVLVGKCCTNKLEEKRKLAWLKPTHDQNVRAVMTEKYLKLLKLLDHKSIRLLELAFEFFEDARDEMVLPSLDLYHGSYEEKVSFWLNFAGKYVRAGKYDLAMQCVNRILAYDNKYILQAIQAAKEIGNVKLLFMFYLKTGLAHVTVEELIQASLNEENYEIPAFLLKQHQSSIDVSSQFEKIREKLKQVDGDTRLHYMIALWKYGSHKNVLVDICQTLISNQSLYQNELQRLLKEISTLDLNPIEKTWFDETLRSSKVNLKVNLRDAFKKSSWKLLTPLLERIEPLTLSAVNILIRELNLETIPQGTQRSIALVIRTLTHLQKVSNPNVLDAMDDLTEAMLSDPSPECIECCSGIIEAISIRSKGHVNLTQSRITELQLPTESHFNRLNPVQLIEGLQNPEGQANNLLIAATEILKAMQELDVTTQPNEIFAYRQAIFDAVMKSYSQSHKRLNPVMQLHMIRSGIAILTAAFNKSQMVTPKEQELLDNLYKDLERLSNIAPLMFSRMLTTYDTIFLNLVTNKFFKDYLTRRRDSESPVDPKFQYWILEGIIKHWFDQDDFCFEVERENTMEALLEAKGWTTDDVQDNIDWPVLPRDENGWYLSTVQPLNLLGRKFAEVMGILFDKKTGEIYYGLREVVSDQAALQAALLHAEDIIQVMSRGITAATFSLDPPNPAMHYHPFQNMVYEPEQISGTGYLSTMLHADVLLKMLSTGVEIGSSESFDLRNADDNLLQRLPSELRDQIKSFREKLFGKNLCHYRFWIEAERLDFKKTEDKQTGDLTYLFGECKMNVNARSMSYDPHTGERHDKSSEVDKNSPEAQFAAFLTENYDVLGKYFPELARLKEMVKLQALSTFAQSVHASVQEEIAAIDTTESKMKSHLIQSRYSIDYPKATPERIEWRYESYFDSDIGKDYKGRLYEANKLDEFRNKVAEACVKDDKRTLKNITRQLQEAYHVEKILPLVKKWLLENDVDPLVKVLNKSERKDTLQKMLETYQIAGIATKLDTNPVKPTCSWVPSAFSLTNRRLVYGGVTMLPKLNQISELPKRSNPPNPPNPPNTPKPATLKARYIEQISDNKIYGTSTWVNAVTGSTGEALELEKDLPGYWGSNSSAASSNNDQSHAAVNPKNVEKSHHRCKNVKKIIKILENDGWVLKRTLSSHQHYTHPTKSGLVTVPFTKKNIDLPIGTVKCIERQANLKLIE